MPLLLLLILLTDVQRLKVPIDYSAFADKTLSDDIPTGTI